MRRLRSYQKNGRSGIISRSGLVEMQNDGTANSLVIQKSYLPVCNHLLDSANAFSHVVDLDPTVSNWHAKFYSVLFDGGPDIEAVPPLVYLQDFSTNGTFWNDNLIGKTSAPVLLTHGDRVKFGPTTLRFFEWKSAIAPEPIDELQKAERKVGALMFPSEL